ncbi:MAG: bifunctional nuclease family protein [Aquificae bacterium]|nr:bifunctional nuclease family protein [Aquificota bacterium]
MSDLIELEVFNVTVDPTQQLPIVLLRAKEDEDWFLPIWIGAWEANAIAMRLQGITPPRPMTYELFTNVLSLLGGKLEKVVINDIRGETFYAQLHLNHGGTTHVVDSRPSDAINLALRLGAPIYASRHVMESSGFTRPKEDEEKKKLREWLESIKPEDFGRDAPKE